MKSDLQKDYPSVEEIKEEYLDENTSLKKMLHLVGENKRVVDFGCATGYFAKLLLNRGCQVTGVELNSEAAKIAEQYCEKVIVADLDYESLVNFFPHQAFDVAVFGDVLEHLRNPWKVLEETRRLLKPEGYVIASIPNIAHGAVRLALLQGRFEYTELGILDDTHLRFFTRQTIEELFNSSGYFIDIIHRTKLPIFSDSTWVPQINKDDFCLEVIQQLEKEEEIETFQFIVRAFPCSESSKYVALRERHYRVVNQLEQSQFKLEQTQAELERSQSKLQQTQAELERSQFYLEEALNNARNERERFQSQLQEKQAELERSQFYLEEALNNDRGEREQLQFQLQQTSLELGRSQSQLQHTQAELKQTQGELSGLQSQLQQTQGELSASQSHLQHALATIAAMETSKFWKLRTQWLKFKNLLRIENTKALLRRVNNKLRSGLARAKALLKRLKPKPASQESQSFLPQEKLLALSGLTSEDFWKLLDPVLQEQISRLENSSIQISILTPTFNSSLDWFFETALNVLNQCTPDWEWCIVDDGSTTPEIRSILTEFAEKHPRIKVKLQDSGGISSATNKALEMAEGEYVCFLDHDDTLAPTALQDSIDKLSEGFDITYSDEDKIDFSGLRYVEPFFKPDWSPEYFRGVMYVGHLLCVRRELAVAVGGLSREYDGVQDYEFMLRLSEITQKIAHIPRILYHWRKVEGSVAGDLHAKPAVENLQQTAVNEHLKRLGLAATAERVGNHRLSIIPSSRTQHALVSIIIPTKDAPAHLERCLKSIFSLSTYSNFEVLLVDNETTNPEALQVMRQFPVKRLHFPNPFNYSRANNLGAEYAQGEYLVFLNNDTEVITEDWLQYLLYYAEQSDVGAVGALLLFPDKTVQHAGVVLGIRGTADHLMRGFPSNVDGYAGSLVSAREVSAVTAACMMVKKSEFYQVGVFNEHFFTHYQDVDLCMRLVNSGKRIIFTPRAVLIHYESATRKDYYDMVDRHLLFDQWQRYIERGDPFYNPNFDITYYDYTVKV